MKDGGSFSCFHLSTASDKFDQVLVMRSWWLIFMFGGLIVDGGECVWRKRHPPDETWTPLKLPKRLIPLFTSSPLEGSHHLFKSVTKSRSAFLWSKDESFEYLYWLNWSKKPRLVLCAAEHSLCLYEFLTHFSTEHGHHWEEKRGGEKRGREKTDIDITSCEVHSKPSWKKETGSATEMN